MSKFNLHPLSIALLGAMTTSVFAETSTKTQNHQLSTIVVSAAGFEQDIKNAPASISVVTKEDIEKKNATSIADLLVDIPGIDVRNGVGKTGNLNIGLRGMGAEYTLILIDGRRQTTSKDVNPNGFNDTASGYLPPLSAIERIEVIRGPMATRYGSEAMGGVINIITKKISNEWGGNVTVSGNLMEHKEEADSWKSSFLINGPIINDKLGIQIRGSYLDRQSSERISGASPTSRDPRPSKANNYDVGAKLDFKLNDQNAFWIDGFTSSQTYKNELDRLGTLDTPSKASGYKDELEFKRQQLAFGHDGEYSFGQWKTYISQTKTETLGRTIPTGTFPQGLNNGADRTLENTDLVIDSHIIAPIANHKVIAGAEYKEAKITDDIAGKGAEFKKDSWSLYLEDEWRLLDNLAFSFGGRLEDHSGFGTQFSPRAYLVWNTNDLITVKGGVSTGYKTPSAKDLHNGIISVGRQGASYGIGSPDLKPETSTNYELGFNFNNQKNLDFTATAFYSQIEDLIVSGPAIPNCVASPTASNCINLGSHIGQSTFSQNINADKAESKGLELSLKYSILPEWDIRTAYTFMETEITKGADKGTYYTNVPKHALNTTSTFHINDSLDIWLQHEYKSARDRFQTKPVATDNNLSDYEESLIYGDKFAGYNIFNLGASYTVNDQLRLNFAVNNLLDKDFTKDSQSYSYTYDDNGTNKTGTATAYKYLDVSSSISGTYLSGRNYWLSISYDF